MLGQTGKRTDQPITCSESSYARNSGLMTGKADRRRPLIVWGALIAVIGAAFAAPAVIGTRHADTIPGWTVRAQSRDAVSITKPVPLFAEPSITLEKGTVSLAAGSNGGGGVGAILRALVMGKGVDLFLDEAQISVDRTEKAAERTVAHASDTLPNAVRSVVTALSGFSFRTLQVSDATVTVLTNEDGQATFSRIDAVLSTDGNGLVTAKGRLAYRGELLEFDVAFTPRAKNSVEPVNVRASVKGAYVTFAFDGSLPPGDRSRIVAENAELSLSDVRQAANWLGADWPEGPGLGPFSAKGDLQLDERTISFANANVSLDGNAASGTLAVTFADERAAIEGTLAFSTLDLSPYAIEKPTSAIARATGWLTSLRIPGLAESSLLNEVDADLRISAANVVNQSERLGRAAASLTVTGGKLYGELVELAFEQGGTGEGQFTADVTGTDPQYTVRADLSDIDFAMLPRPETGPSVLEGVGTLKIDLATEGTSEEELVRSLSGNVSVEMRELSRVGIDINALEKAAAAPSKEGGWNGADLAATTLSGLSARFSALGGVLTADGVEARFGNRTARVIGSVDIDSAAIDFVLSLDEAAGPEGDPVTSIGAYRLQGPWAAPLIRPARPGRAADAAKRERDPG